MNAYQAMISKAAQGMSGLRLAATAVVHGYRGRQIPERWKPTLDQGAKAADALEELLTYLGKPIPVRLHCPTCNVLHEDVGPFAFAPHHTHACQHCGQVWRPAIQATVGVRFLPGFKDERP